MKRPLRSSISSINAMQENGKTPDPRPSKPRSWWGDVKEVLNPRAPQRPRQQITPQARFSIWYFLITLGLLFVIEYVFLAERVHRLPYSEFKQLLQNDQIANVTLSQDYIRGRLKTAQEIRGQTTAAFTTVRVEDPNLIAELDRRGLPYAGQVESRWQRVLLAWVLPFGIFFLIWMVLLRRMGSGNAVLTLGRSKAKVYGENDVKVTFHDVAGIEEAKEELQEIVEFLRQPQKFQRLGGRIPKGVLLVGPPGTGKTLLARAVAGEAQVPFFSMNGSEFVEMIVGVGASRVRDLFAQAQKLAPCIVFIDELDALGKARGANPLGGHDEREQTLNQLLVEMDGFDTRSGVILLAATNRPETLDQALLRPGRFDRQVLVDRPDRQGREAILRLHTRQVRLSPNVNLQTIAVRTPGFVGADLANIVNEAALLAARRNKEAVEQRDLEEAIDRIVAGLEKKNRLMSKKEQEIVAYHEAGHALVAASVPHADPVHRISIIPRGIAALGHTLQLPTEDRYLMTKSELLDKLAVLLGGRVAEEVVFGEISTGAHNDLQRFADIARSMVVEYGMSPKFGPRAFDSKRQPLFLNGPLGGEREYSEETAREIDQEVAHFTDEAYSRVRDILTERRDDLNLIARRLLATEVLEGAELQQLLSPVHTAAEAEAVAGNEYGV